MILKLITKLHMRRMYQGSGAKTMSNYGYLDQLIEEATSTELEKAEIVLEICRHEAGMLPLTQLSEKARSVYLKWEEEMKEGVEHGSSKGCC